MILAMAIVGGGAVAAQAASRYVGSPVVVQEQSNWCWVAAGKSLTSYHAGSNPSQCTAYKWGKGGSTCPNNTGTLGNIYSILVSAGLANPGSISSGSRSFSNIQGDLNVNRPAVARWGWDNTGGSTGHIVVIRGYDNSVSTVSYMNPLNSSYQSNTYSWMVAGGGHKWTDTLYGAAN
ncbi:hypothetical protein C5C56_11995 [Rathayibacter sp. AY1D1]|nr:hypothetical protein C5C56_11995 [Rathayibacter sp. AY1D1]